MNRFNGNFTGGLPYYNDDFIYIAAYLKEYVDSMLARYAIGSNVNFIISGCVPTIVPSTSGSVTAGYVYLNGEILKVEAQTIPYSVSDVYKITKQTTTDSAGNRVLKNTGLTVSPYEKNRGIVSNTASVAANELSIQGNTLQYKIEQSFTQSSATKKGIIELATATEVNTGTDTERAIVPSTLQTPTAWLNLPLTGNITLDTGGYVKYRKNNLGYLEIAMTGLISPGTSPAELVGTIPILKPTTRAMFTTATNTDNETVLVVVLETDGDLRILNPDTSISLSTAIFETTRVNFTVISGL